MPLTGLDRSALEMVIFGGKGGVGKTSCALATALWLSGQFRTIIISTDPAHSIADSLGQPVGSEPVGVSGVPALFAMEVSASKAFRQFKTEHEEELVKLFDTSSNLDDEDIREMMSLSIPGIDEMMSLKVVFDLIATRAYERYVIDTAPTGHALRLINSPALLDGWVKMAAKMRWKYRYMIESFSGDYQPDKADSLLLDLKKTIKRIETLLTDPARCEFIPVCIPEEMAISETVRLVQELLEQRITVRQMVMNNVMEADDSEFCRKRRRAQDRYLLRMDELFKGVSVSRVPQFSEEIRGLHDLHVLKQVLFYNN